MRSQLSPGYAGSVTSPVTPELLRAAMHDVVRGFGLLAAERTPCGQPLAVAEAHALMAVLAWRGDGAGPTLRDLRGALALDKSNVTRVCQRLESRELIALRPCRVDGRARRITLTAKGRRLANEVDASSRQRFARLLEVLPARADASVVRALQVLAEAIHASNPEE